MNQAKGSASTSTYDVVRSMELEDPELADAGRIQNLVTYDIVPEIELYLHSVCKRLHSSLDEQKMMFKDKNDKGDSDSEENKVNEDGDDDERQNRFARNFKRKKE